MITCSHAGDCGDIIYAGPTMRAIADAHGDTIDLVVHPSTKHQLRVRQTPQTVEVFAPLLRAQPYVGRVRYADAPEGLALDAWREWYRGGVSLANAHLLAGGFHATWSLIPWLAVADPTPVAPVVFYRSPRYHNPDFPWREAWARYHRSAVMVGLPHEHEAFEREVGPVRYHPTADLLELARVIAGSRLFVGNQSCPYAIAEGLKHNTVQETWIGDANCVFARGNAVYGLDANTPLPRVRSSSPSSSSCHAGHSV